MKDAVATMGAILPDDASGRDAVHVAVFSAISAVKLFPGQDVGAISDGEGRDVAVAPLGVPHIGIVDPFLRAAVPAGERFWVYLYPRTITGLAHRWSHPAFEESKSTYAPPSAKLASEKWIRDYADGLDLSYGDLMYGAADWLRTGDYLCQGGKLEGISTSDEFWVHYEIVKETHVDQDRRENFFTCSC